MLLQHLNWLDWLSMSRRLSQSSTARLIGWAAPFPCVSRLLLWRFLLLWIVPIILSKFLAKTIKLAKDRNGQNTSRKTHSVNKLIQIDCLYTHIESIVYHCVTSLIDYHLSPKASVFMQSKHNLALAWCFIVLSWFGQAHWYYYVHTWPRFKKKLTLEAGAMTVSSPGLQSTSNIERLPSDEYVGWIKERASHPLILGLETELPCWLGVFLGSRPSLS